MSLPVSLDAVADELDALTNEMTAFVNRRTGELYTISEDDAALVEEGVEEEDLPAWQVAILPKLREIFSGDDWVELSSKFDVHEWEIMKKFADNVDDKSLGRRLVDAIHGKGAFRMFRATVEDAGVRDAWFEFKREEMRRIASAALSELGIPYR